MLHNSGPFGPNETPINMGAPVNRTQIAPMSLGQNMNELGKTVQNQPESRSSHYNLSNYNPFGLPHLGMSPHMSQYPIYPGFQGEFPPRIDQQNSWQNNLLPMNLNSQANHSSSTTYYPNNFDQIAYSQVSENEETHLKGTPLTIPQTQTKSFQNVENTYYNEPNEQFYNSDQSYNLTTPKPSEKYVLDNTKRKSLENTVRLIEDLLINTTKNKEAQRNIEKESKVSNDPQNVSKNTTNITMEKIKDISDVKCTNVTSTYEESQIFEEKSLTDSDNESSPTQSTTHSQKTETSDVVKPENKVHNIKIKIELPEEEEEQQHKEYEESAVTIKIESMTNWIEVDSGSVFQKDTNGVMRDELTDSHQIVDADNSVAEATGASKLDPNPAVYYECPHCNILLNHPKRFLIHTKWHMFGLTNERRMELAKERELRRRKKHQDRSATALTLQEAEIIEQSVGPLFRCKDCDKVFLTKSSMKNHRYRTHPLVSRECKICHITLNSWTEHRAHLATHNNETGFYCTDCPKKFKFAHSLAKHRDTHLEKTLSCDQCPKKFGSMAQLKSHGKVHERAERGMTFHCSYCGKGFYEAYNLGVHERTHRNERPYLCSICNTSFGTNSSLKRHLKVSHNSAKPHACSVCHRSFISESIRDRHEMRLHGDPGQFPYECDQCELRYLTNKDLQKHVYKVHPKGKRKKRSNTDSE